jgi:hypothetical protein
MESRRVEPDTYIQMICGGELWFQLIDSQALVNFLPVSFVDIGVPAIYIVLYRVWRTWHRLWLTPGGLDKMGEPHALQIHWTPKSSVNGNGREIWWTGYRLRPCRDHCRGGQAEREISIWQPRQIVLSKAKEHVVEVDAVDESGSIAWQDTCIRGIRYVWN